VKGFAAGLDPANLVRAGEPNRDDFRERTAWRDV
jgi:hypothetical protein